VPSSERRTARDREIGKRVAITTCPAPTTPVAIRTSHGEPSRTDSTRGFEHAPAGVHEYLCETPHILHGLKPDLISQPDRAADRVARRHDHSSRQEARPRPLHQSNSPATASNSAFVAAYVTAGRSSSSPQIVSSATQSPRPAPLQHLQPHKSPPLRSRAARRSCSASSTAAPSRSLTCFR
jgi:hypothetical protein